MTTRVRTLDFLPEIFKTKVNEQFLSATLDQLTQQPNLAKVQGFIGSKFGYGVNSSDAYLVEPNSTRSNYQLEPSVIFKQKDSSKPVSLISYPEIIDALSIAGSNTSNQSKLFSNQFYSWDSFIDLDKLVNYSQYYWLPMGPEPLTVTNVTLNKRMVYVVNSSPLAYNFSAKTVKIGENNPEITLVRGGEYYFVVDQDTPFYLQTMPDISGVYPSKTNLSLREIYGVENNGAKTGTIKFTVPQSQEQDEWVFTGYNPVDLATTKSFNDIHNKPIGSLDIDGVTELNGKTIMFVNSIPGKPNYATEMFDTQGHTFDETPYENQIATQTNTRFYKISYVGSVEDGFFMELHEDAVIPNNENINVQLGTQYSGRMFVKNSYGEIILIPIITASLDMLYYRDGVNEDKLGKIKIVDYIDSTVINVNEILGKKTYVSPNDIVFTNGLCVQFAGNVFPKEYENGTYYVEGVGTSINLVSASELLVPEAYSQPEDSPFDGQYYDILSFGDTAFYPKDKDYITISRNATNKNAWSRSNRWFHADVLKTVLEHSPLSNEVRKALGNPEAMAKRPIIEFYPDLRLINSGVTAKRAVSYINLTQTNGLNNVGGSLNYTPDGDSSYLYDGARVIFAGDSDINVRNKIFVVKITDTIQTATVEINSCSVETQTDGSALVTYQIDTRGTAFPINKLFTVFNNLNSSFNGTRKVVASTTTSVTLLYPNGVIGTWDLPTNFVTGDTVPTPTVSFFKTNMEATLSVADDGKDISYLDQVAIISGETNGGKTFYFDGSNWIHAQQKTRVNQPPLFDLFDANGHSLGDFDFYPGSDFVGSTLFEYASGTGPDDLVLGFPVKYNSAENIGDILFNVTLNTSEFHYSLNNQSVTSPVSIGYVYTQKTNDSYTRLLGWVPAIEESFQYQVLDFTYTGTPYSPKFTSDVKVKDQLTTHWPTLVVYVDNARVGADAYTVATTDTTTTVTLTTVPAVGTPVTVMIYSDQTSQVGYYQIPTNLDHNPYNKPITSLSLGEVRGHYKSIFNNAPLLVGSAFGPNNYRDLGDLAPYGTKIIQNSAPLPVAASFLQTNNINFFNSLKFNSDEYVKYKNLLVSTLVNNDFDYIQTDALLLDEVIAIISEPKTETNSFFWSDMLPAKRILKSTTNKTTNKVSKAVYLLSKTYDFKSANYSSVLVYLTRTVNNVKSTVQLIRGIDYIVSETAPQLEMQIEVLPNDSILINEYDQTFGSFIPNTPTKLGLYPAFIPEVVYDDTYNTPAYFIKGHDGSLFKLYGDIVDGYLVDARDRLVLEFEKRVYNNLKISTPLPLTVGEVLPGYFRDVGVTYQQHKEMYETQFINWVGQNRIDYSTQVYISTNEYTWNYAGSTFKLSGETIEPGNWRGIYLWLYDTVSPHTTPWEMLGLVNKPTWWDSHYGAAPYTSDNLLMWTDISKGYVWNNGDSYINKTRVRDRLLDILPVDTNGNLVSPFTTCITTYEPGKFNSPWKTGDFGPGEYAYLKSSTWPFDMMHLLALTRPAKFFALCADVDNYYYNNEFNQYLSNDRARKQPSDMTIYGTDSTTAKHGYLNWIVDYATQFGIDGAEEINKIFANTDVRLTYRVSGFTDKDMIRFYMENSSTTSSGAMLIPDESYSILLHNNQPTESIVYSSIIVQKTAAGFAVYGNKQSKAYFNVFTAISGLYDQITVNSVSVNVAKTFYDRKTKVPYGTEFTTLQQLMEFIKGYGLFLSSQGMIFDDVENGAELTWDQMLAEVLYWAQSGWEVGSTVNVNPAANVIKINREDAIVQSLTLQKQNFVLNQNLIPIQLNDLSIYRNGTEFSVKGLNSGDALSYFNGTISTIEHVVIFDNETVFSDLIYNPVTALRQQRLYVRGTKTAEWKGLVDTGGFLLSQDNIEEWVPNQKYAKGTVVKFKNEYYMANVTVIQPSVVFNYSDWLKTSYEMVQHRMIPNASTRSAESIYFYDKNRANLANDADLLSFSLIGYRPRDYLAGADLDDSSQVNLYTEMISNKGTVSAVEGLQGINLKADTVNYSAHENWAIKNSEFGGTLNQNFVQFGVDENKLTGNPSIVSIIKNEAVAGAQQMVPLNHASNYGRTLNNENILPQLDSTATEVFPSAGYVNLDDVIELGYSINDLSDAGIGAIYRNDYIWVANNKNKWDVYTPVAIDAAVIAVTNNLNGTVNVTFNKPHGLLEGQSFGVINFNSDINGFHSVLAVAAVSTVVVELNLPVTITNVTGTGLAYLLQSQRVNTPRDIPNLPLMNTEYDSTKVWVDQAKDGSWAVYNKHNNYTIGQVTEGFYSESLGNAVDYIPGFGYFAGDSEYGQMHQYISLNDDGRYIKKSTITKPGTGFGAVITHTDEIMVVSAPTSNLSTLYVYRLPSTQSVPVLEQTINIAGGYMGTAIAVSGNSQYIYTTVTDETSEAVFLFSREKELLKTSSGVLLSEGTEVYKKEFKCSGNVVSNIKEGQRITFVTSYSNVGILSADFTATQTDAFTGSRPAFKLAGDKRSVLASGDVVTFTDANVEKNRLFNIVMSSYDTVNNVTLFYVDEQPVYWQNPSFSAITTGTSVYKVTFSDDAIYTVITGLYDSASDVTTFYTTDEFTHSISADTEVYIASINYELTEVIAPDGIAWTYGDNYGAALATNYEGSKLFVTAPNHSYSGSLTSTGQFYAYDKLSETWEVDKDQAQGSFYVARLPWYPSISSKVYVNNKLLKTNQYVIVLNAIIIGDLKMVAGDLVRIDSDNMVLSGTFINEDVSNMNSNQQFGKAIACNTEGSEIIVGAPNAVNGPSEGAVYRFTDAGKRYGALVGTIPAALIEPTYMLINGFRVNLLNECALLSNVQTGSTSAFIAIDEAALLPETGVIGFRNASTGQSESSVYVLNRITGELEFKAYNEQGVLTSYPFAGTGSYSPSNTQVLAPLGTAVNIANEINKQNITNIFAYETSGRLIIRLRDMSLAPSFNKLSISVFNGNYLTMMGFVAYPKSQTIYCPHPEAHTSFGETIAFSDENSFVVGAPTASSYVNTKFDFSDDDNVHNDTGLDNNLTAWEERYKNAGAVYMFDYIDSYDESLDNIGKYVYSQSCNAIPSTDKNPRYGASLAFSHNTLIVGAPDAVSTTGKVTIYRNYTSKPNWSVHRKSDQVVNVDKINKVQLFDNLTGVTEVSLDYIDPLQGKLLGAVQSNLDFIASNDPASYNSLGATTGNLVWSKTQLGKIWFDISNVKFLNYHQDDVVYNSKHWGEVFPGSDVAVYTWVESSETPAAYTGTGTPYDFIKYSVTFVTDSTDKLIPKYYFWVRDTDILNTRYGKTLSDMSIARYISKPRESGIAYFAPLRSNTYGLYNAGEYIYGTDTSLHIGYSTTTNDTAGHVDYKLIRTNYPADFLPGFVDIKKGYTMPVGLYEKYVDSFVGEDSNGAIVPDPTLPVKMRYGVGIRPRQSMFVNRLEALKNFIQYTNNVLSQHPVMEYGNATLLSASGADFDTTLYWTPVYWWKEGYSSLNRPSASVESISDLPRIVARENMIVSVAKNNDGNREVYVYENATWVRVGVENGTIEFLSTLWEYGSSSTGFGNGFYDTRLYDAYPAQETRYIVRAINEQLFTGPLFEHRNKSLTLMFEFIQSENIETLNHLPWLNKTSLVDINYNVRKLSQISKYTVENTDLLKGYINEVKPYHVVMKEFLMSYTVDENVSSTVSDFDIPAYYDTDAQRYVSPQLVFGNATNSDEFVSSDTIWSSGVNSDWFNNVGLTFAERKVQLVSTLVNYINNTSNTLVVSNPHGLPVQGILQINNEQIAYTRLNKVTGILSGVTRGVNQTTPASYLKGTPVYMVLSGVSVVDSGFGYTNEPDVFAYVDTSIYPAPRREAVLSAVMNNDKVVGISVIDPGDGYMVTPEIVIENSIEFVASNFDVNDSAATDLIKIDTNSIYLDSATVLVTGTLVKVQNNTSSSRLVLADGYYYVNNHGNSISFHNTYYHAIHNLSAVVFKTPSILAGYSITIGVCARATVNVQTSTTRGLTTTMKFDRISYDSKVNPWTPNTYWSGPFNSLDNDASSVNISSSEDDVAVSRQGSTLPITGIEDDNGKVVVTIDYSATSLAPGNLSGAIVYFFRVTDGVIPEILNGVDGKARVEIFRPSFTGGQVLSNYTMKILEPGSIYHDNYTIIVKGSALGGVDNVNDATVFIKWVDSTQGIYIASITGTAVPTFSKFYIEPKDDSSLYVYTEPSLTVRAKFNTFVWNGENTDLDNYGVVGSDYVYLPEPIADDYVNSHQSISLVSYAGIVWACKESNNDFTFDPSKWAPVLSNDLSLSALDRIEGFYAPTAGMPPKDAQQLVNGITYPNTVYYGNSFAPGEELPLDIILNDNEFTLNDSDIKGVVFTSDAENPTYVIVAETRKGVFVFVKNQNLTWDTVPLSATPMNITGFAYYNDMYVITTSNGNSPMFVSFDAKKWITLGKETTFDTIDYDDGVFDTFTLEVVAKPFENISIANGKFFATNQGIYESTNGLTWSERYTFGDKLPTTLRKVAYLDNGTHTTYITVGYGYKIISGFDTAFPISEEVSRILLSIDGTTWEELEPSTGLYKPMSVATSDELVVIVGKDGLVMYSYNASNWTLGTIDTVISDDIVDVAYGNGMFMAVGTQNNNGATLVLTSTDGMTWDSHYNLELLAEEVNSIYFDGTTFNITGLNGTLVQSNNGINFDNILNIKTEDPTYVVKGNDFLYGYGPEELVAGVVTDSLYFNVKTAPGAYWNMDGTDEFWHTGMGFGMIQLNATVVNGVVDFDELAANGMGLSVFVKDVDGRMVRVYENTIAQYTDVSYSVNWNTKKINFNNAAEGLEVFIEVYEVGNGVELTRANTENMPLILDEETGHSAIVTDVDYTSLVIEPVVFAYTPATGMNKLEYNVDYTFMQEAIHANDTVGRMKIVFSTTYNQDTDYIAYSILRSGITPNNNVEHTYSVPETEMFTNLTTDTIAMPFVPQAGNGENMVVEKDGLRLRPEVDYSVDTSGPSFIIILSEMLTSDNVLAVTTYNGMSRQFMTTTSATVEGTSSGYSITLPNPAVPFPMEDMRYSNSNRMWVTINGTRIDTTLLSIDDTNTLSINSPVNENDVVVVTAMVSEASPNESRFVITVNKRGEQQVLRANAEDATWLTQPLEIGHDIMHVRDATYLIEFVPSFSTVEFDDNYGMFAYLNVQYTNISGAEVKNLTTGDSISASNVTVTVIRGRYGVAIDGNVSVGDLLQITNYVGDVVLISNERIHFESIDLENNTLSGLSRGTAGTHIHEVHAQYSQVFSVSPGKMMKSEFLSKSWNDFVLYNDRIWEIPLQMSKNSAAEFLKLGNI